MSNTYKVVVAILGLGAFFLGYFVLSPSYKSLSSYTAATTTPKVQASISPSPIISEDGYWRWDENATSRLDPELPGDWVPNVSNAVPSEKALKITSQIYVGLTKQQQEEFQMNNARKGDESTAIKNYALRLDADPVRLALNEAVIAKSAAAASAKVINNYQAPPTWAFNCTTYNYRYLNSSRTRCY